MADETNGEVVVSGLEELLKLQSQGDILYVVDADGNSKKMQANVMCWQLVDVLCGGDVGLRRMIKRGRDLAELYTVDELAEKCKNKDFSNLFIDDYYESTITTSLGGSETVRVEIWDFNHFLNQGDTGYELTDWHIIFGLHDQFVTPASMNASNTTEGGYASCAMRSDVLPVYYNALNEMMGGHILTYRRYNSTTVNTSAASAAGGNLTGSTTAGAWDNETLGLCSEQQVYGCQMASSSYHDGQSDQMQFAKFALEPEAKISDRGLNSGTRGSWWLCAVASSASFVDCGNTGNAGTSYASNTNGVRPYFLFG